MPSVTKDTFFSVYCSEAVHAAGECWSHPERRNARCSGVYVAGASVRCLHHNRLRFFVQLHVFLFHQEVRKRNLTIRWVTLTGHDVGAPVRVLLL